MRWSIDNFGCENRDVHFTYKPIFDQSLERAKYNLDFTFEIVFSTLLSIIFGKQLLIEHASYT